MTNHDSPINSVQFSSNTLFLSACAEKIIVFSVVDREIKAKYVCSSLIRSVDISCDIKDKFLAHVLCGTDDGDLYLWKIGSIKSLFTLSKAHQTPVVAVFFNEKFRYVLSCDRAGVVKILGSFKGKKIAKALNPKRIECLNEIKTFETGFKAIKIKRKLKRFVVLENSHIKIWNYKSGELINEFQLNSESSAFDVSDYFEFLAFENGNVIEVRNELKI